MFLYHVYLIWAGTTTNESSKWSEWRQYIDSGLVYKWVGDSASRSVKHLDPNAEPYVDWPIHSDQVLFRSEDGQLPDARSSVNGSLASSGQPSAGSGVSSWKLVYGLHEVENLYDLGFWDNLRDVFWPIWDHGGSIGSAGS